MHERECVFTAGKRNTLGLLVLCNPTPHTQRTPAQGQHLRQASPGHDQVTELNQLTTINPVEKKAAHKKLDTLPPASCACDMNEGV